MRDHVQSAASARFDILMAGAEIAMTAGHRKCTAGVEETWTRDQPVFKCLGQSMVAAAHIAQTGKSAIERMAQHPGRMRRTIGGGMIEQLRRVSARQPGMDMAVDQDRKGVG